MIPKSLLKIFVLGGRMAAAVATATSNEPEIAGLCLDCILKSN